MQRTQTGQPTSKKPTIPGYVADGNIKNLFNPLARINDFFEKLSPEKFITFADDIFKLEQQKNIQSWDTLKRLLSPSTMDILREFEFWYHDLHNNEFSAELNADEQLQILISHHFQNHITPNIIAALNKLIELLPPIVEGVELNKILCFFRDAAVKAPNIANNDSVEQAEQVLATRLNNLKQQDKHYRENFLKDEKQRARLAFPIYLQNILTNEQALVNAFNDRGSIIIDGRVKKDFKNRNELYEALFCLDTGPSPNYKINDPLRIGQELIALGFSKEEIDNSPLSTVLIYEAALFSAVSLTVDGDIENKQASEISQRFQESLFKDMMENDSHNSSAMQRDLPAFRNDIRCSADAKHIIATTNPCIQVNHHGRFQTVGQLKQEERRKHHSDQQPDYQQYNAVITIKNSLVPEAQAKKAYNQTFLGKYGKSIAIGTGSGFLLGIITGAIIGGLAGAGIGGFGAIPGAILGGLIGGVVGGGLVGGLLGSLIPSVVDHTCCTPVTSSTEDINNYLKKNPSTTKTHNKSDRPELCIREFSDGDDNTIDKTLNISPSLSDGDEPINDETQPLLGATVRQNTFPQ